MRELADIFPTNEIRSHRRKDRAGLDSAAPRSHYQWLRVPDTLRTGSQLRTRPARNRTPFRTRVRCEPHRAPTLLLPRSICDYASGRCHLWPRLAPPGVRGEESRRPGGGTPPAAGVTCAADWAGSAAQEWKGSRDLLPTPSTNKRPNAADGSLVSSPPSRSGRSRCPLTQPGGGGTIDA